MLEKWNETVRMVKKHYFFSVNSTARWFSFHWRTNFCSHCFICTHKWKVYWRNGPLILSYEVLGTHSKQCPLKERRWTVGFLDHLTCTWFFRTDVSDPFWRLWLLPMVTVFVSPTHHYSRSFSSRYTSDLFFWSLLFYCWSFTTSLFFFYGWMIGGVR